MVRLPTAGRLAALVLFTAAATAQTRPVEEGEEPGGQTGRAEERAYDELVARFQTDYFRVTTLVQIVPRVPFEETEGDEAGFDVAAAWLGIGGRLGENVGYFVRGNVANAPSLLEAYVSYGSDDVRGIVGQQKAPFSAEFLTGAADIDFVNRSRAVTRLVPGRSTGGRAQRGPRRRAAPRTRRPLQRELHEELYAGTRHAARDEARRAERPRGAPRRRAHPGDRAGRRRPARRRGQRRVQHGRHVRPLRLPVRGVARRRRAPAARPCALSR